MKIAYLINYDINQNSGVVQKIKEQVKQWHKSGETVYIVSLKTMTIYDNDYKIIAQEKIKSIHLGRLGTAINLLLSIIGLNKLLKTIELDVLYMRYMLYMPFFVKILKRNRVVMEINSDDLLEYKLHSKLTHWYNKLTRNLLLNYINGYICVSSELKNKFTYLKKPITVIANGVDTEQYLVKENKNSIPTLVFIGTPNQPWHGLDKIEKLAEHCPDYQFYVIGTDKKDKDNIKYFGYLSNIESSKIIQQCDIGLGTLSLYKTGLTEASPLKTRQYLACGLSIIYAYNDTDITKNTSFTLKLENSENNLDFNKIKKFVDKVFFNKQIKLEAKEFAENILSYRVKEQERLNFFSRIVNAN